MECTSELEMKCLGRNTPPVIPCPPPLIYWHKSDCVQEFFIRFEGWNHSKTKNKTRKFFFVFCTELGCSWTTCLKIPHFDFDWRSGMGN